MKYTMNIHYYAKIFGHLMQSNQIFSLHFQDYYERIFFLLHLATAEIRYCAKFKKVN